MVLAATEKMVSNTEYRQFTVGLLILDPILFLFHRTHRRMARTNEDRVPVRRMDLLRSLSIVVKQDYRTGNHE
jgi:hypothetical protein